MAMMMHFILRMQQTAALRHLQEVKKREIRVVDTYRKLCALCYESPAQSLPCARSTCPAGQLPGSRAPLARRWYVSWAQQPPTAAALHPRTHSAQISQLWVQCQSKKQLQATAAQLQMTLRCRLALQPLRSACHPADLLGSTGWVEQEAPLRPEMLMWPMLPGSFMALRSMLRPWKAAQTASAMPARRA